MIKNSKTRQTRDELPAADIFGRCSSHPASLAFDIFEATNVSDMKKNRGSQPKPSNCGRGVQVVSNEHQTKRPWDHRDEVVERLWKARNTGGVIVVKGIGVHGHENMMAQRRRRPTAGGLF